MKVICNMNTRFYLLLTIGILVSTGLRAQNILKGTVYEGNTTRKVTDVFVRDINGKSVALGDNAGRFSIQTEQNHVLVFTSPGYVPDTLYLVDLKPKRVEMHIRGITLAGVDIISHNNFNPRQEYPEVYEKSKFALSPSRIFGREARQARRLKHYFEREVDERKVDSIFSPIYVSSIVPLKGRELEDFMTMYRPSLSFLEQTPHASLTLYINDCYKKFMALPPEKRTVQRLFSNQ